MMSYSNIVIQSVSRWRNWGWNNFYCDSSFSSSSTGKKTTGKWSSSNKNIRRLKLSFEEHLESISESISDMKSTMLKAAKTSLNSKIVSMNHLSELCVEAILSVADIERNDVDLDLINIQTKIGKI